MAETTLRANHLATATNLITLIETRFTNGLAVVGRLEAIVSVNPLMALRTLSIVLFKTTLTDTLGFAITGHFPHFGFLEKLVAVVTGVVMRCVTNITDKRIVTHYLERHLGVNLLLATTTFLNQRSIQDVVSATGWAITGHSFRCYYSLLLKFYSRSCVCQASHSKRSGER